MAGNSPPIGLLTMKRVTNAAVREATRSSQSTALLLWQIRHATSVPWPTLEFRFHETRKWRFDLAWESVKLAVEIDGGIWRRGGGAHTGTGHLRDMEKSNEAQLLGWRVFHFTPQQVKSGEALAFIERLFT